MGWCATRARFPGGEDRGRLAFVTATTGCENRYRGDEYRENETYQVRTHRSVEGHNSGSVAYAVTNG